MQSIFLNVLDMSITASLVILAVIIARLLLKKAPKKFSYALWALVLLRLLCPWSIESVLSLIPEKTQSIPQEMALEESVSENISAFEAFDAAQRAVGDTLNGGIDFIDIKLSSPAPVPDSETAIERETVSASHSQVWLLAAGYVWPLGMAAMLLWSAVSYIRLRRRLRTAAHAGGDIWLADGIDSPFVMGLFRPKIYLPSTIGEAEKGYIIAHERCHIRRKDHVIKLLAFAALCLHWFNPLVWLAFALYSRDMEMSCDEAVIGQMGEDIRADYSASLLSLATGRRAFAGTPLAFGEGDPRGRIKNLAAWKKPAVWLSAVALVVLIVAAVCLLTDPESHGAKMERLMYDITTEDGYTIINQRRKEVELSVPKDALPDSIYSERHDFAENEVVVYDDGTTSIWLEYVMPANETDEQLYFSFACSYELPKENGSFLSVCEYEGGGSTLVTAIAGIGSDVLAADNGEYSDAVSMRAQGPGERFVFYVSTEAVKAAEGSMKMSVKLNELWYRKATFDPNLLVVSDGGGRALRSADIDHDGVGELIWYWEENGVYYLRVQESDGTLVWESDPMSDAEMGMTSFLLYSEDGEDYLVAYSPGTWQGVARAFCIVFHIQSRGQAILHDWIVEYKTDGKQTAEMAAFAENANAVLEKSRLLLSTLGGEVVIGPVAATDVPQVYPVSFYADSAPSYNLDTEEERYCRAAFDRLGGGGYLHYTSEYYLDGVLCADMPQVEGWMFMNDWLTNSVLVNEQGRFEQMMLEKDGVQYVWMKYPDKEQWMQAPDGTFEGNLVWLSEGWGDKLSFIGEAQTGEGRELSFRELYYDEYGVVTEGAVQIYRFDADGALRAIIRTGESYAAAKGQELTTIYSFPYCLPGECEEAIDAAYAKVPEDVPLVAEMTEAEKCRAALETRLSESLLHYTVERGAQGPKGETYSHRQTNVWLCGDDWLSVEQAAGNTSTSTRLVCDMRAYSRTEMHSSGYDTGWAHAGGSYKLTDLDPWLFGDKGYGMELLETRTEGGSTIMEFAIDANPLGIGEQVVLSSGQSYVGSTETYYFDNASGELYAVKLSANLETGDGETAGLFVTYCFYGVASGECDARIYEALGRARMALGEWQAEGREGSITAVREESSFVSIVLDDGINGEVRYPVYDADRFEVGDRVRVYAEGTLQLSGLFIPQGGLIIEMIE